MMTAGPPRYRDAFALGGWLFADLLLALAIVFIAASPAGSVVEPTGAPTPTPTPTPTITPTLAPTPTPTPEPTICRDTADLQMIPLRVDPTRAGVRASDASIVVAFRAKFEGRRIGLLLTFVHGVNPDDGGRKAADVNALLRREFPTIVSQATFTKDYFTGTGEVGRVAFEAYLAASECGP